MQPMEATDPASSASRRVETNWRRRLLYAAMSALLAWHVAAIVIAPVPDSELTRQARKLLEPYLTLLGLDNGWSFFAPHVENGIIFRYEVEATGGARHIYNPSEVMKWYHPDRRWTRDRFGGMLEETVRYADAVGAALCKAHAELRPVSVTLIQVEQKDFDPEDRLAGKSPLDPEFLETQTVKSVPCPAA